MENEIGKMPSNASEFLEAAAKIVFDNVYMGSAWKDGEATGAQNICRNIVGAILALPGAEHYHGYQKTGGDFGILRDETGDDIDVAFAVGRFTFMVADTEDTVNIAEADGENWKRQADFPVVVVEHFLKGLFENAIPVGQDTPLELTNEMEYTGSAQQLADHIDGSLVQAQIDGEDIFVLGSLDDTFKDDIAAAINRHSRENLSNTPDFILADFMEKALVLFSDTSRARERWYGKSLSILSGDEHATLNVGEYTIVRGLVGDPHLLISGPEGAPMQIKAKSLTDFLERRLNPNERPLDPDHGN